VVYLRVKLVFLVVCALMLAVIPVSLGSPSNKAYAAFDPNNLINDPTFIDINAMSAGDIQSFLNSQGGFLKDFSEGSRSAAQIIYDASHGYGDATGTINGIVINSSTGTVNPRVILVALQKEQGLLNMPTRNDASLNAAMGYACPDGGGCNSNYAGFTKQVEWGAWQHRYNYERAQGRGFSDYQVGQTMTFADFNGSHTVTFANRATASLYRYTPHVYNGNYNFVTLMESYFPSYHYSHAGQNPYPTIPPGDAYNFVLLAKNTGSATWQRGVVNLATDRSRDRVPFWTRESANGSPSGWVSPNRIQFQESSVPPGGTATYSFFMRNDGVTPGTYREYFRLVADGVGWMEDYGVYWDVRAGTQADRYHHSFVSQNGYPTVAHAQAYNFVVRVQNTGSATWTRDQVNLATDRARDRIPGFARESADGSPSGWISQNRIRFQEASVPPGGTATYSFYMRNDSTASGTYREYFRVVADGVTWMEDYGIYYNVTVP